MSSDEKCVMDVIGIKNEITILGKSNMKTRHSVQTIMAHCCVVFCTNDW